MMSKKFFILFGIFLLVIMFYAQQNNASDKFSSKTDFSLHIFSSTNLTGNIEPCG